MKEIPLNEISENLKMLLKNVRGFNFPKEIPFNDISENIKILLKFEKKSLKRPVVVGVFEKPYSPSSCRCLSWTPEGEVRNWSGKALVQYVQD